MVRQAFIQAQKQVQSSTPIVSGIHKCDKCRKKKPRLQREAAGLAPESVPPIVHEVLRSPGQPLDPATRDFMEPRFGHDFSRVPINANSQVATVAPLVSPHMSGPIQAKLAVNKPGDEHEQEADRIAVKVMRMPEPPFQNYCPCDAGHHKNGKTQGTNEQLYFKPIQEHDTGETVPTIVQEVIDSPGKSLHPDIRAFFEPRFGIDLSLIRVHNDAKAAESAQAINAFAYTVGRNIVFGSGKSPGKDGLTAHELTHIMQQNQGPRSPFPVPAESIQRDFRGVTGSHGGVTYERRGNVIEVIMPWSIDVRSILNNVYGALHDAVSRSRPWDRESWVEAFRSSLDYYLSQIITPVLVMGPCSSLTRKAAQTCLFFSTS